MSQTYIPPPVDLRLRLSRHDHTSFYSEADIAAYLDQHFEYVVQPGDESEPCNGIVNWYDKKAAAARLISHLPSYAQILLIERNCDLKLYSNRERVNEAYHQGANTDRDYAGAFYDPRTRSINWAIGGDDRTCDFLHEIGHAIDHDRLGFISNLPQLDMLSAVASYRLRGPAVATDYRWPATDLCNYLESYLLDRYPHEATAELFPVSTLLQLQYPDNPEVVDQLMTHYYSPIWETMCEKYLPMMKRKALDLYDQTHESKPRTAILADRPELPVETKDAAAQGAVTPKSSGLSATP